MEFRKEQIWSLAHRPHFSKGGVRPPVPDGERSTTRWRTQRLTDRAGRGRARLRCDLLRESRDFLLAGRSHHQQP